MPKRISIVTLSFNQGKYLRQAIESILNQDYENLEYIIVDPGSTDGSREIIQEYSDMVDKVIFKPDSGPAKGLNNGFGEATGDIYGYLNSDDILYQDTLQKVNQLFSKYTEIDVISAHGHVINENGEKVKKLFSHQFDLGQYLYENCILVQQSTFFKSTIFQSVNGFNEENHIAWDGELMVDFAKVNAKFKIIQDYWSGFRIYSNSITCSDSYKNKLSKDYIRLRNKHSFPEINSLKRKVKWFVNWLKQPITLFNRIYSVFE